MEQKNENSQEQLLQEGFLKKIKTFEIRQLRFLNTKMISISIRSSECKLSELLLKQLVKNI